MSLFIYRLNRPLWSLQLFVHHYSVVAPPHSLWTSSFLQNPWGKFPWINLMHQFWCKSPSICSQNLHLYAFEQRREVCCTPGIQWRPHAPKKLCKAMHLAYQICVSAPFHFSIPSLTPWHFPMSLLLWGSATWLSSTRSKQTSRYHLPCSCQWVDQTSQTCGLPLAWAKTCGRQRPGKLQQNTHPSRHSLWVI